MADPGGFRGFHGTPLFAQLSSRNVCSERKSSLDGTNPPSAWAAKVLWLKLTYECFRAISGRFLALERNRQLRKWHVRSWVGVALNFHARSFPPWKNLKAENHTGHTYTQDAQLTTTVAQEVQTWQNQSICAQPAHRYVLKWNCLDCTIVKTCLWSQKIKQCAHSWRDAIVDGICLTQGHLFPRTEVHSILDRESVRTFFLPYYIVACTVVQEGGWTTCQYNMVM